MKVDGIRLPRIYVTTVCAAGFCEVLNEESQRRHMRDASDMERVFTFSYKVI